MARRRAMLAAGLALGGLVLRPGELGAQPAPDAPEPPDSEAERLEDALLRSALEPWSGDLDGILERGMLRVALPYGLATFFHDTGTPRGLTYDAVVAFEAELRRRHGAAAARLTLVVLPAARDRLLPMVTEGRADLAAGNLTITPERERLVAFSRPFREDVRELLVTGPAAPPIGRAEDVLGTVVHVRRSSSYFEHLAALNARRAAQGLPPVPVAEADENLEAEDLAQMADAGMIPATVLDEPLADLLVQLFDRLRVHDQIVLASGQRLAWAVRKDARRLLAEIDAFVPEVAKGSRLGNILLARYLKSVEWARNALAPEDRARLREMGELFRAYAGRYDFDWLMIAAQAYQESGLDQSKRSPVGAVGVMQVMPRTARDPNVAIPEIEHLEPNIHAGVKYLRFLRDRYFSDTRISALDRTLFSFAAYNAGPGNVAKARRRAQAMGLDPDVWLNHVEVAAGKVVSREPVVYVRNIYKYFVAYKLAGERG
jgi:membrane-bound lytic murein transglycosylase MltF